MKTPIMIDMQQLNAEPAAVQAVLHMYLILTYIPLTTSLVCLFCPELMAFQVKHVKVEQQMQQDRDRFFLCRNSSKTKMDLENAGETSEL